MKFKLSPLIQGPLQKVCTSLRIIAIFVYFNKFFQGSKVSERTIMILNTKIAFTPTSSGEFLTWQDIVHTVCTSN